MAAAASAAPEYSRSASGYAKLEEGGAHVVSLRVSFGGRSASNVVSEGALLQLVLCFLLSPARADPYVVGPLIALYALREDDRRALVLYGSISAASTPLDLGFLFGGGANFFVNLLVLGSIALKAVLVYVAVKAHDELPAARPGRIEPAKLQAKVQEVVEAVMHEVLEGTPPPPAAGASARGLAPPPQPPQFANAATPAKQAPPAKLAPAPAPASSAAPPPTRQARPPGPTPPPPPPPTAAPTAAGAAHPTVNPAAPSSEGSGSWEEV
jgi:hypothetical protein